MQSTILIRPQSASLKEGSDETFGKFVFRFLYHKDPFIVIHLGSQSFMTKVCKGGGRYPAWQDRFTPTLTNEDSIKFEIWEYDPLVSNEIIGEGYLYFNKLAPNQDYFIGNIPLSLKNKSIGVLIVEVDLNYEKRPQYNQQFAPQSHTQTPQGYSGQLNPQCQPSNIPHPQNQYPQLTVQGYPVQQSQPFSNYNPQNQVQTGFPPHQFQPSNICHPTQNQQQYPQLAQNHQTCNQPKIIYRADCQTCFGKGFYQKKHKTKVCKPCMYAMGVCHKCGGTGINQKKHKPCKCTHHKKHH